MSQDDRPGPRVISTPGAPRAIGPYSQALSAGGLTFVSGQIPLDPETGELVGAGDVVAQTRRVMQSLLAIVEAAGHARHEIVRCTIFLKNLDDFQAVNGAYAEALGDHRPARATVEVARLPRDVLVEIDATCARAP
ncbi:MAG: RidA family protein [Deltaproteobacteria bacterium]|nr:RidA family protein [Deltaproteobacteria bacterium]